MNKGELVEFLVEKDKLSKTEAGRVLDSVIEGIRAWPEENKRGSACRFRDFQSSRQAGKGRKKPENRREN